MAGKAVTPLFLVHYVLDSYVRAIVTRNGGKCRITIRPRSHHVTSRDEQIGVMESSQVGFHHTPSHQTGCDAALTELQRRWSSPRGVPSPPHVPCLTSLRKGRSFVLSLVKRIIKSGSRRRGDQHVPLSKVILMAA